MGARAHTIIENFVDDISGGNILEIGCSSVGTNDDSTGYYLNFVKNNPEFKFHGITVDDDIYVGFKELKLPNNFHIHYGDPLDVLDTLDINFSFVYMDGFDFVPPGCETHDWIPALEAKYRDIGETYSTERSAEVHFDQLQKILPKISEKAIILFDDTARIETCQNFLGDIGRAGTKPEDYVDFATNPDGWYGKGMTCVPWLLEKGWSLIPKTSHATYNDAWTALKNY